MLTLCWMVLAIYYAQNYIYASIIGWYLATTYVSTNGIIFVQINGDKMVSTIISNTAISLVSNY